MSIRKDIGQDRDLLHSDPFDGEKTTIDLRLNMFNQ